MVSSTDLVLPHLHFVLICFHSTLSRTMVNNHDDQCFPWEVLNLSWNIKCRDTRGQKWLAQRRQVKKTSLYVVLVCKYRLTRLAHNVSMFPPSNIFSVTSQTCCE